MINKIEGKIEQGILLTARGVDAFLHTAQPFVSRLVAPKEDTSDPNLNPVIKEQIEQTLRRESARYYLEAAGQLTYALGAQVMDVMFLSPFHYIRELKEAGFKKTAFTVAAVTPIFPAVTAWDSINNGDSLEMTAFRTVCALGAEGLFGATPLRTSLRNNPINRRHNA